MKIKSIIILTIILCISIASSAQDLLPTSTTGQIIQHTYYTLSYSEDHEQAEWVFYKLTPKLIYGSQSRTDNFRPDPLISTISAQLSDYRGSGYDRGHLCPAGDMKLNRTSMSETFYMSNMSPQDPAFNRGIWKTLEAVVRNWAINEGHIYVVTGAILRSSKGKIGASGVSIPKEYYKVIYDPTGEKMIALILPNESSNKPLQESVVSVDYVESMTGINFFPALGDEIEDRLEGQVEVSAWSFLGYTSTSTSSSKVSAIQCRGIAKSTSVRCKNRTTNLNGYCHYHQDQATGSAVKITNTSTDNRCQVE